MSINYILKKWITLLNRVTFYAGIIFLFSGCNFHTDKSKNNAEKNNKKADVNTLFKKKYAAAYKYFSAADDSLKLKALDFLINNLNDQFYIGGSFSEKYKSFILSNDGVSTIQLKGLVDSLQLIGYDMRYNKDSDIITSEFLINNINEAFTVWQLPWAKSISFSDFCEYILPYKSANEKPVNWRTTLRKRYEWVIDSARQTTNPIIPVNFINKELGKWYKVSLTFNSAVDLDYDLAKHVRTGSCDNACKMVMYPMKALGLPVALDYVPHWGNRSSNHSWNVLLSNNKKYPFDGTEASIGSKKIQFVGVGRMNFKISKVFRKTYSIQKNSLNYLNNNQESIPEEFKNNRIKDVTSEYVPTSNLSITASSKQESKYAYLTVFNDERWVPVDWGLLTSSNKVKFANVGRDITYLAITYTKKGVTPITQPFVLNKSGIVRVLIPDTVSVTQLKLLKKFPEDDSNNIAVGDLYELFYWNNGWQTLGKQQAKSKSLIFNHVPSGALYWLRDLTAGKQERVFTYENSKQVWW